MSSLAEKRSAVPNVKKAPSSDSHGDRVFPSPSKDRGDREGYYRDSYDRRPISRRPTEEEGVEVILGGHGTSTIVDHSPSRPPHSSQDQNVFRPPRPVRPRAVRAQGGPPPPPHVQGSGSYGYGAPPPEYGHRAPYPVPYNPSGSFDDGSGSYHQQPPSHYSPHVQYPPPGVRHPEDVNVISPNHKVEHSRGPPPVTPRSSRYGPPSHPYHYPPTSPVSRPGGPPANSPPRMRNYGGMRREGPYSAAQRGRNHPEDGTFNPYPAPITSGDRPRPPLVAESSFDSDHYSSHQSHASHPTTPNAPHHGPPMHDPRGPYYGGGSFGSFDSHAPPPPHFDDQRYYGHHASYPPESPYSHYSYHGYSPGGYYESPHTDYSRAPHSYEDDEHRLNDYPHDEDPNTVTPGEVKSGGGKNPNMILPKAAAEIDFDVCDPPMEPITPPSKTPVCESPADINSYDVLCGRGGGTNSQVGNRRFRKLVQEFQPTYLMARRKEKPLLARTIVLIIRKRAGRFLKKDEETGELYEVGDQKAEAKTSQALREGLDVRATKSAASSLMDKKKKKKGKSGTDDDSDKDDDGSVASRSRNGDESTTKPADSPPTLPRLAGEEQPSARSPSPEAMQFRKRRRMRSGDSTTAGCIGGFQDKLFSEFCPPRADIGRAGSPPPSSGSIVDMGNATTTRRNAKMEDDDDIRYEAEASSAATGCAGIALDMMTGAAAGSFCLGPRKWR